MFSCWVFWAPMVSVMPPLSLCCPQVYFHCKFKMSILCCSLVQLIVSKLNTMKPFPQTSIKCQKKINCQGIHWSENSDFYLSIFLGDDVIHHYESIAIPIPVFQTHVSLPLPEPVPLPYNIDRESLLHMVCMERIGDLSCERRDICLATGHSFCKSCTFAIANNRIRLWRVNKKINALMQ